MDTRTVGAVAALTGVSVRTLHHYDHIGLVVPSMRTAPGYRGYTDADVERLHLVLVYRAAGLPLDDIATLLDDPNVDTLAHLRRQHKLLLAQTERLHATITALEKLMDVHRSGIRLTAEEQVEIFGTTAFSGSTPKKPNSDGATPRHGSNRGGAQPRSPNRIGSRSRPTATDGDALLAELADARRDGVAPRSARANALARRHRDSVERFYDCAPEMHIGLAQMYLSDDRFNRYYDDVEPGLARFVHDIIVASYPHVDSGT